MPPVQAREPEVRVWHPSVSEYWGRQRDTRVLTKYFSKPATILHPIASAMVTQFPDPRLIQYDCGKLQTMDRLLRQLKAGSHRVLIFTQMTKMLDVLEAFLNFHGHIYLRLDGSTKIDQRQVSYFLLFNKDTVLHLKLFIDYTVYISNCSINCLYFLYVTEYAVETLKCFY